MLSNFWSRYFSDACCKEARPHYLNSLQDHLHALVLADGEVTFVRKFEYPVMFSTETMPPGRLVFNCTAMNGDKFDIVKIDSPCVSIRSLLCISGIDATSVNGIQVLHRDITDIAFEDLADLNLNMDVTSVDKNYEKEMHALERTVEDTHGELQHLKCKKLWHAIIAVYEEELRQSIALPPWCKCATPLMVSDLMASPFDVYHRHMPSGEYVNGSRTPVNYSKRTETDDWILIKLSHPLVPISAITEWRLVTWKEQLGDPTTLVCFESRTVENRCEIQVTIKKKPDCVTTLYSDANMLPTNRTRDQCRLDNI